MRGPDLFSLVRELKDAPGVDMVVTFGNTLHVSGTDERALERTAREFARRPALEWSRAEASLEDVFIKLMEEAPDNFVRDAEPQRDRRPRAS